MGAALADFTALIEAEPRSAVAYHMRAHAYMKAGKDWEGLADIDRALALKPDDAEAVDTKARLLEGVGKRADAIAEYRRALLINPRLEGARSVLKRLGASEDPWLEWRDRAVAQARGLWNSPNKSRWILPLGIFLMMVLGRNAKSPAAGTPRGESGQSAPVSALSGQKASSRKQVIWWGGGAVLLVAAVAWATR